MNAHITSTPPHTADVIIIGGGLAGTSALWAIERAAPGTRTVLIERSAYLGSGSSLASLECYRSAWAAPCLARQMARSLEVLYHADEYLGDGASRALALKPHGYLFCAFTAEQADTLHREVAHLHAIGLSHVEYLDADEVAYRFPWLGPTVVAAKFDPRAGRLDSNALIQLYVRAAPPARVIVEVPETQICVEGGRVTGVKTSPGNISAPRVVIAAGAWSRAVGRAAGVELPVVVRPRQSFTTSWRHTNFPEDAPLVIGACPFPHVRPEAGTGAIFGWEYDWSAKYADPAYRAPLADALIDPVEKSNSLKDPRFPSITLMLLARQFGHAPGEGFADDRYLRGVSHNLGYYVYRDATTAYRTGADGTRQPYTSERAILDAYPGIEGLFLSVAHVGHGIMSSPAGAEILACKVLERDLPDPVFADFGIDVPWVEYDENTL
jgi:glycine/D-amino acid oxidase-like deaminating enzyme